jgi:hypothetical protein
MGGLRGLKCGLAILFACSAAALLAVPAAETAPAVKGAAASTGAKPKWLVLPDFWPADASGATVIGSASGRGWVGFLRSDGASNSTLLGSLRRVGGRLSFAKAVLTRSQGAMMIVGSQLVYHSAGVSTLGELWMAPLLANGGVGTPKAVPDDPESIPPHEYPRDYHPGVAAAVQVGDRTVWVLAGFRITGRQDFMWACCTSAGELSDLSRFIDHKRDMEYVQLGLDTKGRLWLAWLDVQFRKSWGAVRMVELDPDSLAPRTPTTFVAPGDSWAIRPKLVCADRCRMVGSDLGGDIITWAPGERSVTRTVLGSRHRTATLLAASFRSRDLVVASAKFLALHRPPWQVAEITIVRGDARGSHARRVGVIDLPGCSGNWCYQGTYATFVPGGLVYFALYDSGGLSRFRVLAGFLPLTR